jgi:cellulose synthase/poly-beta-1,6-N-acetylglucosamine synthase-like glycosyltransferase
MSEVLGTLFLFFALATLLAIIVLICVHLYQIFEEPAIQKRMRQLRKPVQPWVTVLLYARNNEASIEASLKALLRSHYHHYDIVVVDDCSRDGTFLRVRNFITIHPESPVNYLHRRVHQTTRDALKAGYRKSKKGKVVISLQADTLVSPSFLKRAVAIKQQRMQLTMRVSEPVSTDSLSGIIQTLKNLVWHHMYQVQVSDAKNINAVKRQIQFDFLGVFILAAIILTSLAIHEAIIFWYSWLIVTSYVWAVIWLNEEKIRIKLRLTFSALSALFLLPVASIVMVFSQVRTRN